ncbi:2-succinyl-5-enolpyruvyl-6-hydroxy-3-cyclohexene-1-carboxylic-acid synthase [Robiginitalea sediminis]|uniref:2-succinyl-5-enolpyruvyl-6-hydroxy-3- cyclohexene-1-carboxylic-acid synthase n=1 Tax=Robiginitalea sediminis TaxID=1982593 RepID=UPI000B4ACC32|nr:2-succinyl-5-enolpyruvyl-6-hydroxy-3-cyclohexene-1-carboxylic-acid synthase [Robiginitalea sediminis]
MRYSNIPLAHTAVEYCKKRGIRQVVISPGSRNAPLILAFSADPFFECFSIVDERSAGFFALGLSQQSGLPTALVCTSGSALVNYYPAVCEAYYSRIPLVVLSADRPPYKIDIGDGQTIRQEGVLSAHIGYEAHLRQDATHASNRIRWEEGTAPQTAEERAALQAGIQEHNEAQWAAALDVAFESRLPVHLNLPFEEPLYGTQDTPPFSVAPRPVAVPQMDTADFQPLWEAWNAAGRKMVLVGILSPGAVEADVLKALAQDPSVMVFTETTSNLHHPSFFPSIDSIMAPLELGEDRELGFRELQPEILVTLGGMVVSKKIKQFLRNHPPREHWCIHPQVAMDTYYCLSRHIQQDAGTFLSGLLAGSVPGNSEYRERWAAVWAAHRENRATYLEKIPFSDFQAFGEILKGIPDHTHVQLANSSTVRYAQLFDMHPSLRVFCNRGTSGIEGSTSTAMGAAWNTDSPTLLITGDLSFFYDSNAFWNQYLREDFRIILINNSGGGIFRILPGREDSPAFETYFETTHGRTAEHMCLQFGLAYSKASTLEELRSALETFYIPTGHAALLEVFTARKINDRVLLEYFEYLT